MAPSMPQVTAGTLAPGPTGPNTSPEPHGASGTATVTQPPGPQGGPNATRPSQPPGPTVDTATVLLTATEQRAGDLHDAAYASWFVLEKHYDDFLVDYGMNGKPGFRVPKGRTKWQASFQWFWTDDLANVTDPNAPPPTLPAHGFNITYEMAASLVKPVALPGDAVYRDLINCEPYMPRTI
jgi:hypothetical protein